METTYVETEDKESTSQHGTKECTSPHISIFEHSWWNSRSFAFPDLHDHETSDEHAEKNEESDDTTIAPWVLCASPLKGKQQADYAWKEERCTSDIQLLEFAFPVRLRDLGFLGRCEEENDEDGSNSTKWKIDVEAGDMLDSWVLFWTIRR
jgi:hypothetical protein